MTDKKKEEKDTAREEGGTEFTREEAAQAGGYNLPGGAPPITPETGEDGEPVAQPVLDPGAAAGSDDPAVSGGVDRKDRDRVTTQGAREAAGPFTGQGNQDALRTQGRQGASDAHHADQRTSGDESAVEGAEPDAKKSDKKGS
jgi:hypothetical protein